MRAEPTSGRRIRVVSFNIERPAGAWRTLNPGGVIRTVGHSTQTMIGDRYWPRMPRPLLDKCFRIETKVIEILDRSISDQCVSRLHTDDTPGHRIPKPGQKPHLEQRDEHMAWIDFFKLERNLAGYDLSREVIAAMTPPPNNIAPRLCTNREAVAVVIRATRLNLTNFLIKMVDGELPHARRYVVMGRE